MTKLVIEGEELNRLRALVPLQIEYPYQDILLAMIGWEEAKFDKTSSRFRETLLYPGNFELRKVSLTSTLCWTDRDLANTILTRIEEKDLGISFLQNLVWVCNPTNTEVNTLLQDFWIRLWEKHGGDISLRDKQLILCALQRVCAIGAVEFLTKIARDTGEHEAVRENAAGMITRLEGPMSNPVWDKCVELVRDDGLPQCVRVTTWGELLRYVEIQLLVSKEDQQLESRRMNSLSLLDNLVASMRTNDDFMKMARWVSSFDNRVIQRSKAVEILQHILSVVTDPRTRVDVETIKEWYERRGDSR
jgi:hypothetical protein